MLPFCVVHIFYVILFYFFSFIPDLPKDFENSKKRVLPKDTACSWKRKGKDKEEKGCGLAYESNWTFCWRKGEEGTHKLNKCTRHVYVYRISNLYCWVVQKLENEKRYFKQKWLRGEGSCC